MNTPSLARCIAFLSASALVSTGTAVAHEGEEPAVVHTAVAGARYGAGPLHKALWGPHYRKLWTTPISVEVLDLAAVSGGLTPKKTGGGKQTKSLQLQGADGREWKIRSVDKDPTMTLRPELRESAVDSIIQDQISGHHPGAALVADGLADAAGIFHPTRRLVIVPDDERLGAFRREFAGMLAYLEEDPQVKAPVTPGLEGAADLLETVELWRRLDENPAEHVDERAFLKARLFDHFIGDWDRHKDQWDWARWGDAWRPLPKDRDLAFCKLDGFFLAVARPALPRAVDFETGYPNRVGLAWQARFLDRRHLAGLEWPLWQEVVSELQSQLTDSAIEAAVRRLPKPWYDLDGRRMEAKLKNRRRLLPGAAREFYALLAQQPEVHGTDRADQVEVRRQADGSVEVTMATEGQERFHRLFRADETDEVRIQLKGGDDRARTYGISHAGRIQVRVVGGDGSDLLDDSKGGRSHFYDHSGEDNIVEGPGTVESNKPYAHPEDRHGNPLRDWGTTRLKLPWVAGSPDLGLFLGGGLRFIDYGFRKHPYASRQDIRFGYATGRRGVRAVYDAEFLPTNSRRRLDVLARYSEVELLRFHGFGNEAPRVGDDEFHKVRHTQYLLRPAFRLGFDDVHVSLGPVAKWTSTPLDQGGFIAQSRPYGVGDFGQAGLAARLQVDSREETSRSGALMLVEGAYYPQVWDVRRPFGEAHGQVGVILGTAGGPQPSLALRVGGKKLWGTYPFHEAAFLGGPDTVRGLRRERYAGDAMAYGNAELRIRLFRAMILVPTDVGLMGLADAGRVWVEGDPIPDRSRFRAWHTAVGGGVWMSFLSQRHTVSLTMARGEGENRIYFQSGLLF